MDRNGHKLKEKKITINIIAEYEIDLVKQKKVHSALGLPKYKHFCS